MRSIPFSLKTKGFEDMHMRSEKGFTLVEMAVVLVIAGLILGGAMVLVKPFVQNAQINTTKIRLENIANSLALYAQTYGRLPCPADENPGTEPFGAPRNSGPNGEDWDEECGAPGDDEPEDHIGIVPFRALGLSEDNAKDAYGNFVTYAVAPVLAGSTTGDEDEVHEACRQPIWFDGGATNINPRKARVCCARWLNPNTEIVVNDSRTGGNSLFTGLHTTGAGGPYGDINAVDTSTPMNTETRFIAFLLNSTGQNGEQALVRAPDNRKPIRIAGTQETENNDYDDFIFVSRPRSVAENNNYFDDIILWRTNDQLVSNFGNDSCNKP